MADGKQETSTKVAVMCVGRMLGETGVEVEAEVDVENEPDRLENAKLAGDAQF